MVDDSKYVIVPHLPGYDQDTKTTELTDLVTAGWRIISKANATLGVHYVLIKFKAGNPNSPRFTPTQIEPDPVKPTDPDPPINLEDIPF